MQPADPTHTHSAAAEPARLMVLISGSGRSLINLHDRCLDGTLNARIAGVIASRPCAGVKRARDREIQAIIEPGEIPSDRLAALAHAHHADLVVLAGYLRRVDLPPSLEGRVINIHPALLPGDGTAGRFGGRGMYGAHVHRAVLEAGETQSGCTVHVVTNAFDSGPVILQKSCPVNPDDTPADLAARVFQLELEALPEAVTACLAARAARTS